MRILSLCFEYPPIGGGGGAVCESVCRTLAAMGSRVDVVTSGMGTLPKEEVRDEVRIFRTPGPRRRQEYATLTEHAAGLIPAYRKCAQLMGGARYDVIHGHFIVPSGLVAAAVSRRFGVPYVLTAHGSDVDGYNPHQFGLAHRLVKPVWRRVVRGAAAVTTPSRFLAELLKRDIELDVNVIPNSFATHRETKIDRKNRILVVSRTLERKGIQTLIEAFGELDTDWELMVVGDGPYLETLQRIASEAGVRVSFSGFVRGPELATIYASAKIFVLPSYRENFPVVLLEAMASGCTVITTTGSGCEEVVGAAGELFEAGDVSVLRGHLRALMGDSARLRRLGEMSRSRARMFSESNVAKQFHALLSQCCDSAESVQVELSRPGHTHR